MGTGLHRHRDHMQLTVAHAPLDDHTVGKRPHRLLRPRSKTVQLAWCTCREASVSIPDRVPHRLGAVGAALFGDERVRPLALPTMPITSDNNRGYHEDIRHFETPMDAQNTPIDADFLRTLSVLYVEDEEEVRTALTKFLRRRFDRVDVAENGSNGLNLFRSDGYDVVVTDVKMPVMDGLEMARQIKAYKEETPVIVVTAYNETDYFLRAIEVGVDRYVKKPVDPSLLIEAIYKATQVRFQERELEKSRQRTLDTLTQTIAALSRAIEKRASYTDSHQKRVAQLAEAIARELGLPPEQVMGIQLGALIHDVGFISVPAEILVMPGRLDPTQMSIIKTHPKEGADILGNIDFPWPIASVILQHHERWDGSGYPDGLKGEEITLEARIIGIADVVEAMASHRPYRPALGIDAALAEIQANRGTLYDPTVVDCCMRVMEKKNRNFW